MKTTLLALLLLYVCIFSHAQPVSIPLPIAGTAPGKLIALGAADIWACYTLSSGYANTVARYDGKAWQYYRNHNKTKSYYRITDFAITANGKIWIASKDGLYYLDPADTANNRYITTTNSNILSNELDFVAVSGNKVFVVSDRGVSVYDGNTFINYYKTDVPGLAYEIKHIAADGNGALFLGTDYGLVVYDKDEFKTYHQANSELRAPMITALTIDKKGRAWIGTVYAGGVPTLFCYDNGRIIPARASDCTAISANIKGLAALLDGKILITSSDTYTSPVSGNSLPGIFIYDAVGYKITSGYGDGAANYFAADNDYFYGINQASIRPYKPQAVIQEIADPVLDANNISIPFRVEGDFGMNQAGSRSVFMPKSECKSPLNSGALWLGAELNNQVYLAAKAQNIRAGNFSPGPVNKDNAGNNQVSHAAYNRTWKIDRSTIEQFKKDFAQRAPMLNIPTAIRDWPAHGDTTKGQLANLAPFVDVDGDGRYNPEKGDYPDIKGDMSLFWIMNDAAATFAGSRFGFEVHGMAYSYACSDIKKGSTDEALNNSVFINYRVINRSNQLFPAVKPGLWMDPDIGSRTRDFIGSNPKEGYGFAYNSSNADPGTDGYAKFPPALAVIPLSRSSQTGAMENFMYYDQQIANNAYEPQTKSLWNLMNSRFSDGTPLVYGETGRNGQIIQTSPCLTTSSSSSAVSRSGSLLANPYCSILPCCIRG